MKKILTLLPVCFCVVIGIQAQVGKVGINTTNPSAMLHVKDSSVVFTGPNPLPVNPGNPPISGPGSRMMWYADKAAFRVGNAFVDQWNKEFIGLYSVGMGQSTKAIGSHSIALGGATTASGFASVAIGNSTVASGGAATSMGYSSNASGSSSLATGSNTSAEGTSSFAGGNYSTAVGAFSAVLGNRTKAIPFASLAIGQFNDTTAISTTTWNLNDPLFIIGNGISDNERKNAMTILKSGKTGINTITPGAMLHVVKDGPTNGPYHSSAAAILESDQSSYIQFSNPNTIQSGILSGNESTSIRSGLIFGADSSFQIRAGGNIVRLSIDKSGNTNITGDIRRTPTGAANMVPICYGAVDANGTILSGTGNFTVSTTPPGYYEVTITSESYTNAGYTTSANPLNSNPRFLSIGNNGGKLVVRVFTIAGTLVDTPFHFVVYKM